MVQLSDFGWGFFSRKEHKERKADIAATKELKDLASRLGVAFLDHIIIGSADSAGGTGFTSLAEVLP